MCGWRLKFQTIFVKIWKLLEGCRTLSKNSKWYGKQIVIPRERKNMTIFGICTFKHRRRTLRQHSSHYFTLQTGLTGRKNKNRVKKGSCSNQVLRVEPNLKSHDSATESGSLNRNATSISSSWGWRMERELQVGIFSCIPTEKKFVVRLFN